MSKIYPDSGVELSPFTSKYYDKIMNVVSMGFYKRFINRAIKDMDIKADDHILDLGCGTGRNAGIMNTYLKENGAITGLDISENMEKQFRDKFQNEKHIDFINRRIDQPFDLETKYDKIFISFVIHGFPHEIRDIVIQNAYNNLKPGGQFIILDFAEFDMAAMPAHHRFVFKKIECKYAFDYIERDWKSILQNNKFDDFSENFYMKQYVRLLKSVKK